jgi:hypothetical protein
VIPPELEVGQVQDGDWFRVSHAHESFTSVPESSAFNQEGISDKDATQSLLLPGI